MYANLSEPVVGYQMSLSLSHRWSLRTATLVLCMIGKGLTHSKRYTYAVVAACGAPPILLAAAEL